MVYYCGAKCTLNQKPKLQPLTSLWRPAHPKLRAEYMTMMAAALRLQKTLPETSFGPKTSPHRTAFKPPDRPRIPPGYQFVIAEDDSARQAYPMGPPSRAKTLKNTSQNRLRDQNEPSSNSFRTPRPPKKPSRGPL